MSELNAVMVVCREAERRSRDTAWAIDQWLDAEWRLVIAKKMLHAQIKELGAAQKTNDRLREQVRDLMGVPREETEWMR